ncbi:MAG: aldehyde dehydrogenase family protein, partial [Aquisalinus sp.]|nr:aldehyde dehydrogenase family protein [Aquisalinus sp.]
MSVALVKPVEEVIPDFSTHLLQQKQAFLDDPMPDYQTRKARLDKLYNAIVSNKQVLLDAISDDFGNRSEAETILGEFVPLLDGIKYYKKNLRSWMKAQRRHVPITAAPAGVKVFYQPLGVIGIVAPWNFPVFLALSPLVGALAAGNRAMIKMSELAPITASTVEAIINNAFDPTEVKVFTGEVEAAVEFTKQPYDHLVYTGSTQVGKSVMHAAAENLTPVTLELGGKSPAIIHEDFPMKEAAKRL